ncbi:xylulokinase [Aquimarina agarilytica]|uniref:xylulokinase n=1 Tax=Aquimarina agarilytica TaxID=1087449 RepID=UPI0002895DB1|nr:FGGY family carbohydrate kinase [Aquimarina agarilytica]
MYSIGYDIGSSSIKAALVDHKTGHCLDIIQEPKNEMHITALQNGWAEQDPELWFEHVCNATKRLLTKNGILPNQITSIGIAYQMHGLVLVDQKGNLLRPAIIWCDSRAVAIGKQAFETLGTNYCKESLLNSPGNFTASKLKWVKENEPEIFKQIHKFMLPGDYIAFRLSGEINTTISGLSEGVIWDYKTHSISKTLLKHYGIPETLIPTIVSTFGTQATINNKGAQSTGLAVGTKIAYRAGDQPNNALALNVLHPGEVAATGGTSGVVYAITDNLKNNEYERINNFAHVNHTFDNPRIGKLLCVNGAGILYRWVKENFDVSCYNEMNSLAEKIPIGSNELLIFPFGNGAERMLKNKHIGAHFINIDLNRHHKAHFCRAALEGIAFAFVYGIDIMKNDHTPIKVLKAGNDNLFQSEIFSTSIATLINTDIELYNTTGAIGAARAATFIKSNKNSMDTLSNKNDFVKKYTPKKELKTQLTHAYNTWKKELNSKINQTN